MDSNWIDHCVFRGRQTNRIPFRYGDFARPGARSRRAMGPAQKSPTGEWIRILTRENPRSTGGMAAISLTSANVIMRASYRNPGVPQEWHQPGKIRVFPSSADDRISDAPFLDEAQPFGASRYRPCDQTPSYVSPGHHLIDRTGIGEMQRSGHAGIPPPLADDFCL